MKHPFRSQDRFYLARCPDQVGTITHTNRAGFNVTYDERDYQNHRVRRFFPWSMSYLFKLGIPPALRKVSNDG